MRTVLLFTLCLAISLPSLGMKEEVKITYEQAKNAKILARGLFDKDPNVISLATGMDKDGPFIHVGVREYKSTYEPYFSFTCAETHQTFLVPIKIVVTSPARAH